MTEPDFSDRDNDHDMWAAMAIGVVFCIGAAMIGTAAWFVYQVGIYEHWWGWDGTVHLPPRL